MTGYQVQYSKDADFESGVTKKTIKSAKTVSLTVNVKKKGTWYFRIRAYKKADGKTIFGEWGAERSIKVP